MSKALIERLAAFRGIGDAYYDYRGRLCRFSAVTKAALLRAMGLRLGDADALRAQVAAVESAAARRLAPPVAASNGPRIGFDIHVAASDLGARLGYRVRLEDGGLIEGGLAAADCAELWRGEIDGDWVTRRRFELPPELPPGYHELALAVGDGSWQRCRLVMSPPVCFETPALAAGRRLWGVAVQLYTLRSQTNWGIGDFADLETLIRGVAARGAGFIGLNPLHALSADPAHCSPYSASDRHFLNVLYLAVPAVPEFAVCAAAQARVADAGFERRLADLRAGALVDYRGVAAAKFEILALLHAEFRDRELAAGSPRAAAFAEFAAAGGAALERHAIFEALDRHFRDDRGSASGWMNWPPECHDPGAAAVREFVAAHAVEVEFFVYLQWLAEGQLGAAQALSRALGMPIGLYGDYAVGANAAGSEVWADRGNFCLSAEIGAPPDPIALKGQGWGIPPQDPFAMQAEGLRGFSRVIRDNMRRYGALRLDHVMALFRLWWVPAGASPADGAYVHYPLHPLMTVLALESARAGCLVVGEDLGVVPDEVRAAMSQYALYHYKVMLFEKDQGRFRRPDEYPRRALATVTTHDMPTIRSYWDGLDIDLREKLNLYPDAAMHGLVLREREQDRIALLDALRAQGLAPEAPSRVDASWTPMLARAMHVYLAGSSAALVAVQLEDLLGIVDPVNVPGTHAEYPNWRRKIDVDLAEIFARADVGKSLDAINRARG